MTDEDESSDNISDEDYPSKNLDSKTAAEAQPHHAESGNSQSEDDEEIDEGWGSSKKDYYNADVIETEADALEEEAEAIKVQKKQLQGLTEADYGFDDAKWLDSGTVAVGDDDSEHEGVIREVLPQLVITDNMGVEERTKLLSTRYPEFGPLSKEFLHLQSLYEGSISSVERPSQLLLKPVLEGVDRESEVQHITAIPVKHSALSAYLAALSMYFALFTSSVDEAGTAVPMASSELRGHPIMETLVQCRKLWEKVKDLEIAESDNQGIATKPDGLLRSATMNTTVDIVNANGHKNQDTNHPKKHKKSRKSKAQRAAEAALAESDARRAERLQRTEEDLARLTNLVEETSKSSLPIDNTQSASEEDDSDFGEERYLTAQEAEEKAKRKKSLRFYTSQIAQKVNKRHNAGRAAGGDNDVPYRERFKDRQARLTTEAEAKGRKPAKASGVALGGDSDDEDKQVAKQVRDGAADEDYYDLVTARSQKKKAEKAALAAVQQQATKEGGVVHAVEEVGPDGKRGITYAIEKNKGLTPKRKKEVRNSRVKKRNK